MLFGLVVSGAIERLAQGVYRMAGAPAAEHDVDATRVHWLALGGVTRPMVAAGKTAAALHRIGDWYPTMSDFVAPTRRTTRLPEVRVRVRQLDEQDVAYVGGIPSMTVERTIADLGKYASKLTGIPDCSAMTSSSQLVNLLLTQSA